jgi:hypothetical protein
MDSAKAVLAELRVKGPRAFRIYLAIYLATFLRDVVDRVDPVPDQAPGPALVPVDISVAARVRVVRTFAIP